MWSHGRRDNGFESRTNYEGSFWGILVIFVAHDTLKSSFVKTGVDEVTGAKDASVS